MIDHSKHSGLTRTFHSTELLLLSIIHMCNVMCNINFVVTIANNNN